PTIRDMLWTTVQTATSLVDHFRTEPGGGHGRFTTLLFTLVSSVRADRNSDFRRLPVHERDGVRRAPPDGRIAVAHLPGCSRSGRRRTWRRAWAYRDRRSTRSRRGSTTPAFRWRFKWPKCSRCGLRKSSGRARVRP